MQANQLQDLQAPTSTIDLNNMMLDSWKEWDALLTRWFSLNGTLSDLYDYTPRSKAPPDSSNTTLSGIGFYIMSLVNMYEQTSDNYCLSKLRAIVEGSVNNPDNYVNGGLPKKIFYVPAYYVNGTDFDTNPSLTMAFAFASVKLWNWTGAPAFKQLADKVARESLLLAVVNNATDLAWSQGYYQGRYDVVAAMQGINRQALITLFYTLYGKEIDPTYLNYINRTLHWQFRAQLSSGGLANSIGEQTEHRANTGLHVFLLTWGYQIASDPYLGYLNNIARALSWLQSQLMDFEYMEGYAVAAALINGWKANFTLDNTRAKTAAYLGLKALNFTAYGAFPKPTVVAYGWRFPQFYLGSFLSSYPLPDGAFGSSQLPKMIDYSGSDPYDKDIDYRWKSGQEFDKFRINSKYGSGLWQYKGTRKALYFFFGSNEDPLFSTVENNLYYLNITTVYQQFAVDNLIYLSGLAISQVKGTARFTIRQESTEPIDISLDNGTNFALNDYFNSTFSLTNKLILRQHLNPTHFFFISSPSSTWAAQSQTLPDGTVIEELTTTITNGRVLLSHIPLFNSAMDVSEAFKLFNYYAPFVDQASTVSFTEMVESYVNLKNLVGERDFGLPLWKAAYENATLHEVKIVALYFPEFVSVLQWNFSNQYLTAVISGIVGLDSALKVYSGYRFSPLQVLVNDSEISWGSGWSFDSATRTFMVNITLTSPSLRLDVFFAEDKTPPNILSVNQSILNPEYNDTVTVSASVTDNESGVGRVLLGYWNGTKWMNTTMTLNTNTSLYDGKIPPLAYATQVQYKVYAADRAENWIPSETYSYTVVDTYPPNVTILVKHVLPNRTIILRSAQGDFVSDNATIAVDCQEENLQKMDLYIDGALVKTWDKNGTRNFRWDTTAFADGSSHVFNVIANDLAGNTANASATMFSDNTPPLITNVDWNPKNPSPGDKVTVTVTVTDATSGVEMVNLWYTNSTFLFSNQQMTFKDGVWSGIIPGQLDGTKVQLLVEAFDKADNSAKTQSPYTYNVGYSSLPILLLLIIAVSVGGIICAGAFLYHRKSRKTQTHKSTPEQPDTQKTD